MLAWETLKYYCTKKGFDEPILKTSNTRVINISNKNMTTINTSITNKPKKTKIIQSFIIGNAEHQILVVRLSHIIFIGYPYVSFKNCEHSNIDRITTQVNPNVKSSLCTAFVGSLDKIYNTNHRGFGKTPKQFKPTD